MDECDNFHHDWLHKVVVNEPDLKKSDSFNLIFHDQFSTAISSQNPPLADVGQFFFHFPVVFTPGA